MSPIVQWERTPGHGAQLYGGSIKMTHVVSHTLAAAERKAAAAPRATRPVSKIKTESRGGALVLKDSLHDKYSAGNSIPQRIC